MPFLSSPARRAHALPSPLLLFFIPALLCALLLSGCGKGGESGTLPGITLPRAGGGTYTFGPDDGKVTLVVFWATWCKPCLMEIPTLNDLEETYGEQGFRVVSILLDDPDGTKAPAFMVRHGINYPVLIDDGKTEERFGGLRALPTNFLVGRDGRVKKRLEGLHPSATLEALVTAEL